MIKTKKYSPEMWYGNYLADVLWQLGDICVLSAGKVESSLLCHLGQLGDMSYVTGKYELFDFSCKVIIELS